ncbi:MAG: phosphoribosylanthranilate isomerase [Pirellula sp.]
MVHPDVHLPKLKYCGLTRKVDVIDAIECGADAIGLNFVATSPRRVSPAIARELVQLIDGKAFAVGVFVNSSAAEVARIVVDCGLDCIQLHGDETPEWLTHAFEYSVIQDIPVIRAVTWRDTEQDRSIIASWVNARFPNLVGFLVDAFDPIQRGGTGRTARWDLLNPRPTEFSNIKIGLAGGIQPHNVATAIETALPDGIDVASGIESAPGIKDSAKMLAIAKIAKALLK